MQVKGIRWIGVRTDRVAEMRAFALNVLGMRIDGQDAGDFVEMALPDGSKVELFGSEAAGDGPWLFERGPIVAGLLVDDIVAARDELAATEGVELLGELRTLPDGYAWQ